MDREQTRVDSLHLVATSTNLACVLVALLLMQEHITWKLLSYESMVLRRIGLLDRHQDFMEGYLTFFLPMIVLTGGLWLLLQLTFDQKLTQQFLRGPAGILALGGYPVWAICFELLGGGPQQTMWSLWCSVSTSELLIVLILALSLAHAKEMDRALFLLVGVHGAFCGWQYAWSSYYGGYGGAVGLAILMCAGWAWSLYVMQQNRSVLAG